MLRQNDRLCDTNTHSVPLRGLDLSLRPFASVDERGEDFPLRELGRGFRACDRGRCNTPCVPSSTARPPRGWFRSGGDNRSPNSTSAPNDSRSTENCDVTRFWIPRCCVGWCVRILRAISKQSRHFHRLGSLSRDDTWVSHFYWKLHRVCEAPRIDFWQAPHLPGRIIVSLSTLAIAIALAVYLVINPLQEAVLPVMAAFALIFGFLLVMAIGGADMPTVIAILNSYAGISAAALGFVLNNKVLIVAGSLDGSSGLILAIIMSQAMNRSFLNILFGGVGATVTSSSQKEVVASRPV